jgi:hypothetical protein
LEGSAAVEGEAAAADEAAIVVAVAGIGEEGEEAAAEEMAGEGEVRAL